MSKEFKFNEKTHSYTLDGKPMTGCTTVLSVIAKPALIQWSANEAVSYIQNHAEKLSEGILSVSEGVLKDARTAHRRKKEDAGQKGTDVHALIEIIIKKAIKENGGYIQVNQNEEIPQVQNFIKWAIKNKVQFLESEKRVYSEKFFTAGTADFTCIIDGKKYVGDIKTSSGIYQEYLYQVAGYRLMIEEMSETGFDGSLIVKVGKDGKFNEDKDVLISTYYEEEKEAFLSALKLYRIGNSFSKDKYTGRL